MKPFQILELSNTDYHEHPDYLPYKSRSRITRFIRHGRAGLACERRGVSLFSGNAGTSLGTVVDVWLEKFAENPGVDPRDLFAVPPAEVLASNGARRGNKYKEWAESVGREVCSESEMEKALIMSESIKRNPLCMELVDSTTCTQRCVFWQSEAGHLLKIRSDGDNGRVPWDLKTTASPISMFPRKAVEYGYHHQAALYLDGYIAMGLLDTPQVDFKFLVVQSIPPYRARVLVFPQQVIDFARAQVYKALDDMAIAESEDELFDKEDLEIGVMDVPQWMLT